MYVRPRHRRAYATTQERGLPRSLRVLLAIGALIFAAYLLWTLILRVLGVSGAVQRVGAQLAVEQRGTVSVNIENKDQRAENGMLVFPGEHVHTGPGARAALQFFDGSRARLDGDTDIEIVDSAHGESSDSKLTLMLHTGRIWLATGTMKSFTGSVVRTVTSPTLSFTVASGTETALTATSLKVFSSEAEGVHVSIASHTPFLISSGQQWSVPASAQVGENIYATRATLTPDDEQEPFVTESRQALSALFARRGDSPGGTTPRGGDALTVTAPREGTVVQEQFVKVEGIVNSDVASVLINGYPATVGSDGHFSQQVSPPEGEDQYDIDVQALDGTRTVIGEEHRLIKRAPPAPIEAPTVTAPASTGSVYKTSAVELILRGNAPRNAAGIMVNDYKLQLFSAEKGEWSYVASLKLSNMHEGENVYTITALDATGKKGPSSQITIVQGGEGPDGVVSVGSSSPGKTSSSASSGPLPTNAPLMPGTLSVIAPTAGTTHAESGTGFLLEGTTSNKTASIWVNDYKLQLYKPGKTTWNYIVDVLFNNMKLGTNTYTVVARNADLQILDQMTYTVEYTLTPKSSAAAQ